MPEASSVYLVDGKEVSQDKIDFTYSMSERVEEIMRPLQGFVFFAATPDPEATPQEVYSMAARLVRAAHDDFQEIVEALEKHTGKKYILDIDEKKEVSGVVVTSNSMGG